MGTPGSLSEKDRFLIRNAEIGFRRAAQLLSWWKEKESCGALRKRNLDTRRRSRIHLEYFFDTLMLDDKPASAMGVFWKSRFQRKGKSEPQCGPTLQLFIQNQFLRRCCWTHADGLPGGFAFHALQYKLQDRDEYDVFPGTGPPADLAEIGRKYEWIVLEAVVHDFFRVMLGNTAWLLSRMPVMSSYVLAHRDYFSSFFPPVEGAAEEYCFGYSFLPCPVTPNIFGYGPGKFAAAVKQFRFLLLRSGDVEIQTFFLVSGRSDKILDLRGFDPVYSSIDFLSRLTPQRLGLSERAHDRLDALQLAAHARIYQSLLDGLGEVWENQNWIAASRPVGGSDDRVLEHSDH